MELNEANGLIQKMSMPLCCPVVSPGSMKAVFPSHFLLGAKGRWQS